MNPAAAILKAARAQSDMTLEQVALRCKLDPQTVSNAENGKRRSHAKTLESLAKLYELNLTALISAEKTAVEAASLPNRGVSFSPDRDSDLSVTPAPAV